MYHNEILKRRDEIAKSGEDIWTNFVLGLRFDENVIDVVDLEKSLMVIVKTPYQKLGYFVAAGSEELRKLLKCTPVDVFVKWTYKPTGDDLSDMMCQAGFHLYARYIRNTTVYKSNPYEYPARGTKALLQEMYDSSCGEFPAVEDAEELFELAYKVFDVNCDDVFTIQEWRERIQKKEVLIYRESGKIIACYVWRLQGKVLYSNISINLGLANILYNMERRVFDRYWKEGIRAHYSWKNCENKKALKRGLENCEECILNKSILYHSIYTREING